MTIPSSKSYSGPYEGNGSATVFDYEFRLLDAAHLKVVKTDREGKRHDLTLSDDYSIVGVGNERGTITLKSPLPKKEFIELVLDPPFTQLTDLQNQGAYYPEVVESALDLLTQQTIALKHRLEADEHETLIGALYRADSLDAQLDGAKTSFELKHKTKSFVPISAVAGHWFVYINGLSQYEGEAFTLSRSPSATTIKFTFAPRKGDNIQVSYLRLNAKGGGSGSGGGASGGSSSGGGVKTVLSLDDIPNPFEGQLAYVQADGKLYIYQNGKWVLLDSLLTPNAPPVVPALAHLNGKAAEGTIGSYKGKLYIFEKGQWNRVVEEITAAAIQRGLYSHGLRPIEYFDGLPVKGNVEGRVVFDTSRKMMFMFVDGAWKNFADIYTPDAPTGIEIHEKDPTTGNYEGRTIFNKSLAQLRVYKSKAWGPVVMSTQIGPNSISSAMIQANAITAGKIKAGSIGVSQLAAGAITTDKMAAGSVTAVKLQAGAVAADKIAAGAITADKLAAGSIKTSHLASDFVVAAKVSANSIGTAELKSGAITADKLASGSITAGHIRAGTVTADKIVGGAVSDMASSIGSTRYASVGTWTNLVSVSLNCSSGAKRVINVGTSLSDENSSGSPNHDVAHMQGIYRITAGGSTVASYDGVGQNGSTTLHAYHGGDTSSRSGYTTFILQGFISNFSGARRSGARFRTPTITVTELRK